MSLTFYLLTILLTRNDVVTLMSKRSCLTIPFGTQHFSGSPKLLKSAQKDFYLLVSSILDELSWKISLLVCHEILGMFVNTLTADDKYYHHYMEKFAKPIQMQLSNKANHFFKLLLRS